MHFSRKTPQETEPVKRYLLSQHNKRPQGVALDQVIEDVCRLMATNKDYGPNQVVQEIFLRAARPQTDQTLSIYLSFNPFIDKVRIWVNYQPKDWFPYRVLGPELIIERSHRTDWPATIARAVFQTSLAGIRSDQLETIFGYGIRYECLGGTSHEETEAFISRILRSNTDLILLRDRWVHVQHLNEWSEEMTELSAETRAIFDYISHLGQRGATREEVIQHGIEQRWFDESDNINYVVGQYLRHLRQTGQIIQYRWGGTGKSAVQDRFYHQALDTEEFRKLRAPVEILDQSGVVDSYKPPTTTNSSTRPASINKAEAQDYLAGNGVANSEARPATATVEVIYPVKGGRVYSITLLPEDNEFDLFVVDGAEFTIYMDFNPNTNQPPQNGKIYHVPKIRLMMMDGTEQILESKTKVFAISMR